MLTSAKAKGLELLQAMNLRVVFLLIEIAEEQRMRSIALDLDKMSIHQLYQAQNWVFR